MAIQNSVAVRNASLDAWETAIGTAAKLQLWTGAQPANCAAAATGTKIAEITMVADWAANASAGAKSLNNLPLATTALAGGTAGYYRVVDSAGTTCHEQGSVAASGADLIVDNPTLVSGQAFQITSWTKTAAGA